MKGKRESESTIGQVDVYFEQFKGRAVSAKDESTVELQAMVQRFDPEIMLVIG